MTFPFAWLRETAFDLGFCAVGVARADAPLDGDHARYLEFLAAGYAETIPYLAKNSDARSRLHGPEILAGAKSVIALARAYASRDRTPEPAGLARHIARYARGADYHNVTRRQLKKLIKSMRERAPGAQFRALCDTAPVLERAWAVRAGIGFVGKNGLLIVAGTGSYATLAEVVTDLELEIPAREAPPRDCGQCTRCIDACPTGAIVRPFVVDPRACIAGLTIEQKGVVQSPIRAHVGDWIFGCDDCQQVCPYNQGRHALGALDAWSSYSLHDAARLQFSGSIDEWVGHESTPLRRCKDEGLARNACHVMGASRDPLHLPILQQILDHPATTPTVREAASWAIAQLREPRTPKR